MEEGESGSKNYKVMMDLPVTTKASEFARIVMVVAMLLAIVVACVVFYVASCNNFGQSQLPTSLPAFSFYGSMNITSTSANIDGDLVHDEYYELRKALKAASMKDKTVILTTLNEAWAEPKSIFDIFLKSFKIGNNTAKLLNHLLVIAVDEKAYNRCQATVSHCYFFKSNKSSEMAGEARFMTPIYLDMMWERLAFLGTILKLGHNFVFTDTDVMWLRDPFPHFYQDSDFQTSCDNFNGDPFDMKNFPNNGFNFVKSNNRTIEFYKFWVSSRWRYPGIHEQNVFNRIKYSRYVKDIGLKLRFLDTDYFGGFCTPSRDFNQVCTMHANCCVGLNRKIADLHTTLEDWKMYILSQPNQTALQQLHWRVPNKCLR